MHFDPINSTMAGNNLAYFFVYANEVTNNLFGLLTVLSFFIITFVGSLSMQMKYRSQMKPDASLLASSFATLGFAILLEQYSGILNPYYFMVIISILILSLIWSVMSD